MTLAGNGALRGKVRNWNGLTDAEQFHTGGIALRRSSDATRRQHLTELPGFGWVTGFCIN